MNYPERPDLYQGKFTNGNPVEGIAASVISADQMNAVYDEIIHVIREGGVTEDASVYTQLAQSIKNQVRAVAAPIFTTSGNPNSIILTSPEDTRPVTEIKHEDKVRFHVTASNTASRVTLAIDGLAPIELSSISAANQLLNGALVTVTYLDGRFWLTEQINPKTGNDVNDIGKLIIDTTSVTAADEIIFNGAALSRAAHPILWAKVQATANLVSQSTKNANPTVYAGYYGTGDGRTTFTIPTLGGEFIRIFDDGRGVDSGRVLGSHQLSDNLSHSHGISSAGAHNHTGNTNTTGNHTHTQVIWDGNNVSSGKLSGAYMGTHTRGTQTSSANGNHSHSFTTNTSGNHVHTISASGTNEARPRSIAYYAKTRI